jgi:hypothetical protein
VDKRFESYDWLKAIGGMLFFVAALLPWWERAFLGAELSKTGFEDWLGIIAAVIFLAIGLLTVIVETESLPIPQWVLNPTWMLGLAIVGAICVAVRFFLDPFGGGGGGIRDTRGIGLYLAGAAAVLVLIGCIMAFQRRDEWAEAVARDDEDDEDEADELYDYGYDADEQDELIRRINESMEKQSNGRRRRIPDEQPPVQQPTVQEQRRAEREERANRSSPRRRRPTGPPIP